MVELAWRRPASLPGVDVIDGKFQTELPEPTVLESFMVALYMEGAAELWRPNGTELLTPGALALSSPGHVVRVLRRMTPGARIRSLVVTSEAMSGALSGVEAALPERRTYVSHHPELGDRMRRLNAALDDGADALAVQSLFTELAASFAGVRDEPADGVIDHSLRRARELLHDDLARNVTLDELADAAHLSKYHLVRRFTAAFGLPPHRYHLYARLDRARMLLGAGRDVGAIANELGFADQSHLTRRFSRAFRLSPARYRARMLAG